MLIVLVFALFFVSFSAFGYFIINALTIFNKKNKYFLQQRTDEKINNALKIIIPAFLFLFTFIWLLVLGESQRIPIMFGYLTIGFATVGWLFTNYITSKNSIRQHTLTVLTQMRMSTEFMKNANKLQAEIENGTIITYDYYNAIGIENKDKELKESVRFILNYLEFVSVGIRLGDLDESLVKESQRGMFQFAFTACEDFILERNKINKTTYQHLIATIEKWKLEN
ncbi:DUF4760 domain-containing protein [Acinetobacter radioresistens]|uniref:DUF4760 domain-containing protein n=1 Tax=Acinetobacter radioresistens TaxID=40216 RepID=UPI0034D77023